MNKNERPPFLRGKGAAVGVVICFAAVIVLVGAYTFSNYRRDIDRQMAQAEEQAEELTEEYLDDTDRTEEDHAGGPSAEANTDDIVLPEAENGTAGNEEADSLTGDDPAGGGTGNPDGALQEDAGGTEAAAGESAEASAGNTSGVWFDENSTLTWPASGALIMGYSMDQTVFFQTLEQYQYNPAMIVAGETGETITASAAGIVTDIGQTAKTGTTVSLDMGNGYSAVYGQLENVPLSIGDYVYAGETVGTLSEPTKYYSIEGPNLYFEVLKDGEPVDPMTYME